LKGTEKEKKTETLLQKQAGFPGQEAEGKTCRKRRGGRV